MPKFAISLCLVFFASVANPFHFLKKHHVYKTTVNTNITLMVKDVERTQNKAINNIENLKSDARNQWEKEDGTVKREFIGNTTKFDEILQGSRDELLACILPYIELFSIYDFTITNMSVCTIANSVFENYTKEINDTANKAIEELNKTKKNYLNVLDFVLLIRRLKGDNVLNSMLVEARHGIKNHMNTISRRSDTAKSIVFENVTTCLGRELEKFRKELKKQITEVNTCQSNFANLGMEAIISQNIDRAQFFTEPKKDALTTFIRLVKEWLRKFVKEVPVNIVGSTINTAVQPECADTINLELLETWIPVNSKLLDCTGTTLPNYIRSLKDHARTALNGNKDKLKNCTIGYLEYSVGSVINDTTTIDCVIKVGEDVHHFYTEGYYNDSAAKQVASECFADALTVDSFAEPAACDTSTTEKPEIVEIYLPSL